MTTGNLRFRVAFGLLLAFVTGWYWLPSTSTQASAPHNLLFYVLVMPGLCILGLAQFGRRVPLPPLVVASGTLILYLTASSFWAQGPIERSFWTVWLHALATATFVASVFFLFDRSRLRLFKSVVIAAATSITVISIAAYVLGRSYNVGRLYSAIHFEHPNLFAQALGFAALLALGSALRTATKTNRLVWTASFCVLGLGIVLTRGRTAILAVGVAALLSVAVYRGRKATAAALAVIIIGFSIWQIAGPTFVGFVSRGDAGRFQIWKTLLDRNTDRPLIGAGINTDDNVVFQPGSWEFPAGFTVQHPHSVFVGTLFYGGLIGLALLLLVSIMGLKTGWRNAKTDGEWDPLILLVFGLVCLIPDGHRLVSEPHLSSWLVFWLPIGMIAAGPFGHSKAAGAEFPRLDHELGGSEKISSLPSLGTAITIVLILAALLLRAPHMGEKIDGPHTWRQCDTAQYIHAFYTDGIDLLHPSVCWMGDHRTLILEFPLPEAVSALAYHVVGPSHITARWVTMFFFAGSTLFFFLFVRTITDQMTAKYAAIISMVLPLALFYSRAIHIDYCALFFTYAMAWLWTEAITRNSASFLWLGSIPAALALMIKAPYVLPFVPLLVWMAISRRRWSLILKHSPALILPGLLFAAWQWHSLTVNGAAPDWSFIPTYRLFTNNGHWYFGPLSMRLNPVLWIRLINRILFEITGWVGLVLALIGIGFSVTERRWPFLLWVAGSGFGVLVFFNLNVVHNYYQIILVGPASVAIALGTGHLVRLIPVRPAIRRMVLVALVLVIGAESVTFSERHYYKILEPLRTAGLAIGTVVPEADLVVVSAGGLDPRAPHLLYRARRYGWSIPDRDLRPVLIQQLEDIGAQWLAIVASHPPSGDLSTFLAGVPSQAISLPGGQAHLFIYHLANRPPPLFEGHFEEGSTDGWDGGP